jgi:hypothetical protein
MSEIQQEVRGWLRGWGPPLNKARAHELIAEVKGMMMNIISSSESSTHNSVKVSLTHNHTPDYEEKEIKAFN